MPAKAGAPWGSFHHRKLGSELNKPKNKTRTSHKIESADPAILIQNPAFAIPIFDSGDLPCLMASISIFPMIAPGIPLKKPQQKTLAIPSTKERIALVLFDPIFCEGGCG
jgi:hypothetical protein